MREIRLFLPPPLAAGALVTLPDNTARHALGVLRLRPGARFVAFDGAGHEFDATLDSGSRRNANARLGEAREPRPESALNVTLALGISRGPRMDYAVQKATELGVSRLAPLVTARSVVRLDAKRSAERVAHWRLVAQGACEQCGRATVPIIEAPRTLDDWLAHDEPGHARLLLDASGNTQLAALPRSEAAIALVGPEGGLEQGERDAALAAGYTALRLGPRVLRTETAAVVAITALQLQWGDMG